MSSEQHESKNVPDTKPPEKRGSAGKALFLLTTVAGLVGGLLWVLLPSDTFKFPDLGGEELDFPGFELPVHDLTTLWEAEKRNSADTRPDSLGLLEAIRRVNFAHGLTNQGMFEGDVEALEEDLHDRRHRWAEFRTGGDFLHLGWQAQARFENDLRQLLRLANTTDTRLDDLLANPLDSTIHAYFESCGDFLDHARAFGLIGPTGQVLVQPEFFTLLFRRMWANRMSDHWVPDTVLPAIESEEFLRWRVEDGGLELAERLRLIDRFETEFGYDDYPADFARAVVYAQADDTASAREAMLSASVADPTNPLVIAGLNTLGPADE